MRTSGFPDPESDKINSKNCANVKLYIVSSISFIPHSAKGLSQYNDSLVVVNF
jgi:hypothetical protein